MTCIWLKNLNCERKEPYVLQMRSMCVAKGRGEGGKKQVERAEDEQQKERKTEGSTERTKTETMQRKFGVSRLSR